MDRSQLRVVFAWSALAMLFPCAMSNCADVSPPVNERDAVTTNRSHLPYRGVAIQVYDLDHPEIYKKCIDEIANLGADTVELDIISTQENAGSEEIKMPAEDHPIRELLEYAHDKHLRIIFDAVVMLSAPRNNEWRGVIAPASWDNWFDSYRAMIDRFSTLAQDHHVEVFCVGSELGSTELQVDQWKKTIAVARKNYHGKLVYCCNWDRYRSTPFWDQLDMIGMNSYWKLGDDKNVTVRQIEAAWKDIQRDLMAFHKETKKPILFMEVGWCSQANAALEPWDYTKDDVPIDNTLQRKLYEGFFRAWEGNKTLAGYVMFEWLPDGVEPAARAFTPKGKPAEDVLREWWKRK